MVALRHALANTPLCAELSAFGVKGLQGSAPLLSRHQLHRTVPRSDRKLRVSCTNESGSANLSLRFCRRCEMSCEK